jgi:hypothetical protein
LNRERHRHIFEAFARSLHPECELNKPRQDHKSGSKQVPIEHIRARGSLDENTKQRWSHKATCKDAQRIEKAIAIALISSGNASLTVRYAELAPADAKKKITHQATVRVVASSTPCWNSHPAPISSTPEMT